MNNSSIFSIDLLISEAHKLKVVLTDTQARQIIEYARMLIEYDKQINLVGNPDPQSLFREHILDSLTLLPIMDKISTSNNDAKHPATNNLIDIGSGAGFPGLVLALGQPDLRLTIVEATGKKVLFLESVAQALDLARRVTVINARAEELAHNSHYRASFKYATCRALGSLPIVCEISLPFLMPGGYAILQRGAKNLESDMHLAKSGAAKLGASLVESILLDRHVLGKDHYVLLFKQEKACLPKYPRLWKEIKAKAIF